MKKIEMINLSLSHATMNDDDLIPTFASFLENNFVDEYTKIVTDELYLHIIENGTLGREETACYLLEDLFDALNNVAPDNCYFGSHVGDGSDYGFWTNEEIEVDYTAFIEGYITCALWSSPQGEQGEIELDSDDLSDEARAILTANCYKFLTDNVMSILNFSRSKFDSNAALYSRAGHSFWLNHNGHGSGFWDYPETWGHSGAEKLSELSDKFDEIELYIGDDGKIYS